MHRTDGIGLGEPHQYGDFGTELMVYGPRSDSELELVLAVIGESISLARGATL